MPKRCSLILLTYNGADYVVACLESLLPQLTTEDEVIVVENGSRDDTLHRLAPFRDRVRVLPQATNRGYAAGNNIGLAAATGRVCILLNQDTVLDQHWLPAVLRTFEHDPAVGIVGCKSHYGDGVTLQHAGGWVERPSGNSYHFGDRERDAGQHDQVRDVEYVSGFAFAVRRELLVALGPLDEAFQPAYGEEIDYCLRARATGWRVVYQPAAFVRHFHQGGKQPSVYRGARLAIIGRLRVLLRHWTWAELEAWWAWEREFASLPHDGPTRAALAASYGVLATELDGIAARRASVGGYGPAWDEVQRQLVGSRLNQLAQSLLAGLYESAGGQSPGAASHPGDAPLSQHVRDLRGRRPELPSHPALAPISAGPKAWMAANVVDPKLVPVWDAAEVTAAHVVELQHQVHDLRARVDALWGIICLLEDRQSD